MHNLKSTFDRIKSIVKESLANFTDSNGNVNKIGAKPTFSDVDLIALSLLFFTLQHPKNFYKQFCIVQLVPHPC